MKLLLTLTFALITVCTYSQDNCDITQEYQNILQITKHKYGEKEYLMKRIKKVEEKYCFSDLINENEIYFDYLQTHFSNQSNTKELLAISDSVKLQNEFIKTLEKDTVFNDLMNQLNLKTMDQAKYITDTISIDEMLNIAVKFFSIIRIDKDGNYVVKFFTGINGLEQTEKNRNPHLEAFCFSTLFENYEGEQFSLLYS